MLNQFVRPSSLVVFSAVVLSTACTHIVRRPLKCAPLPEPAGKSTIGWQRVPGARRFSGQVVAPGSLTPIQGALVSLFLLPLPSQGRSQTIQASTDAVGTFHLDSISPARYLMLARRIGYRAAHDTIVVARDSGIVATAILVPDVMIFDECGMAYQEVRVPWWKRN